MTTSGAQQGIRPGVCLSTSRPASPYIGQIIYMTDVNQSAVWDGTFWVGLDRSRDRNMVINGAMQVNQRGAGPNGGGYLIDQFVGFFGFGTWAQSVQNDAPTGSGFRKSYRALVSAAASPSGVEQAFLRHRFEGQNVQQIAKGTASAKQITVSFWAKSNVTGTYIVNLLAEASPIRFCSQSYTISSSATWERKVITFPADTTGEFPNDNSLALSLRFYLGAGPSLNGSPLQTTWTAGGDGSTTATGQVNVASAINNYWQVTGIQLEAGAVATPFEFEDIGTTLTKCQRYYQAYPSSRYDLYSQRSGDEVKSATLQFITTFRATPVVTLVNTSTDGGPAFSVQAYPHCSRVSVTSTSGAQAPYIDSWTASAEL